MYTLGEIAEKIGGKVIGDERKIVTGMSPIEDPQPDSIVFVRSKKLFDEYLGVTNNNLCIVTPFNVDGKGFNCIMVEGKTPDLIFIKLLELFSDVYGLKRGVSGKAIVAPGTDVSDSVSVGDYTIIEEGVRIGDSTVIGANCTIAKGCTIGSRCVIMPGVNLYPHTVLEDGVILHSGVVVGSDGFGYTQIEGKNRKIPQIGGVYIEKDVEIGANSTVDRATIGYTRIGENTKIDNLVHIGHNVRIGKNSIICAQCGISGSVTIGNNVVIAGAVGLKDHIVIEDDVYIGAKAGVMEKRVKKGSKIIGIPAADFKKEMEFYAMRHRLKGMWHDLFKIKKKLGLK